MDSLLILSGFFVGLLVGLTGVGGGALMTPLLIFGFGTPTAVAVGTDLCFAAITKLSGVWIHTRQSTVDWQIVRRLAISSLPASLLTLLVLGEIDTRTAVVQNSINSVLGLALILTALTLLWQHRCNAGHIPRVQPVRNPLWITTAVGALLGVLVTLTSVGAGALGAAVLFWLHPYLNAARVVGTDLAHALPLTAVAAFGHWQLGSVDTSLLIALLTGSLPGIYLGSRVSAHLPERWLRPALAMLLLMVGFRLVS